MALLPSRNASYSESGSANLLLQVRKGNKKALSEFIWQNQERFYAIAFMSCQNPESAQNLTIAAFNKVFSAIKSLDPKQLGGATWEWMAQFVVGAVWDNHTQPCPASNQSQLTPSMDGSAEIDMDTTVILGQQRMLRCLSNLSEEQRKVFVLRHQLGLDCDQIAAILNQNVETVMAWLFRSRVQIVKELGKG